MSVRRILLIVLTAFVPAVLFAQEGITWNKAGNGYYQFEEGELGLYTLPKQTKTVILSKKQLTPEGKTAALPVQSFSFTADDKKILLFANTKKVWRYKTRGDYFVFDTNTGTLTKLGKN